jgi:two-component system, OmpR family, copper resistance phosphate regulon response regulator CusR
MKLLVAEDEPKTGTYLQQGLSEAGFSVDRVTRGTDALQHVLSTPYDLLILDVMMPGLDGWEVLRMVRAAGQDVPVLFLTARDRVEDRVKGLELTITWSNLSLFPSCWRGCARCCAGAVQRHCRHS